MNSVVRHITHRPPGLLRTISAAPCVSLTGGVSVITAGRGKDISGMTVTSVSSLSVDPPALIVSVNRSASSWPLMKRYGFFGVNILTSDQIDIAERFTGKDGLKGAERFAGAEWSTRASGVPLLSGALAAIDCEVEEIVERHSHAIVIGRVLDLQALDAHARRWPIGRDNMSRSTGTRMRSNWRRSAFRFRVVHERNKKSKNQGSIIPIDRFWRRSGHIEMSAIGRFRAQTRAAAKKPAAKSQRKSA